MKTRDLILLFFKFRFHIPICPHILSRVRSLPIFPYDIALSIILLIAVMVIVVDQITGRLRKEILK